MSESSFLVLFPTLKTFGCTFFVCRRGGKIFSLDGFQYFAFIILVGYIEVVSDYLSLIPFFTSFDVEYSPMEVGIFHVIFGWSRLFGCLTLSCSFHI